jgi:hypothetical protein
VGGILPGFAGLVRWASSLPQKTCGSLDFPWFAQAACHSSGQREACCAVPRRTFAPMKNKCCYLKQWLRGIFRLFNRE